MIYAIMPFVGRAGLADARAAVKDVLTQHGVAPEKLLLIDQGRACFDEVEDLKRVYALANTKIVSWYPAPPLTSLSATWNTALAWAWAEGAEAAWVLNNDVRLRNDTLEHLKWAADILHVPGFVSAYGVGSQKEMVLAEPTFKVRGGPDFSCFLISRELHAEYQFDELFVPAYCEDLDYHRRLLLDGKGDRIFSSGICYYHKASGTLKAMGEEERRAFEDAVGKGSRAHYARKWGGPVNQERFMKPFGPVAQGPLEAVTTPQLFEKVRQGW